MPKLLECRAHTLPVSRAPLYSDRSAHLFGRRSSLTVRARARRPTAVVRTPVGQLTKTLFCRSAQLPARPSARTLGPRAHTQGRAPVYRTSSQACVPIRTLKGRAPQRCRAPIINVIFAKGRPCQVTWALTLGRATFPASVPVVNVPGRLPSLPSESATPCRTVMTTTPCPGVPPSRCAEKRGCDRMAFDGTISYIIARKACFLIGWLNTGRIVAFV